jgi:hypothetical protein
VKLARAGLCLDCDEIYETATEVGEAVVPVRSCPACGSSAPPLLLPRVLAVREDGERWSRPARTATEAGAGEGAG